MKIAVVSTPRSGNTWLRSLLASLAKVPHRAVHHPDDVPWDMDEVVVQIHWLPTESFLSDLAAHGFRVVAIARHPLDVFVSVVQYVRNGKETHQWLAGAGGNESSLDAATPTDSNALGYAVSERFATLLSVTPQWWQHEDVIRVTYEELVADPSETLSRVAVSLGIEGDLTAAIEENSMTKMRSEFPNRSFHFWKGQPGLWRSLITSDAATHIAEAHSGVFAALGYSADADPQLSESDALGNWYRSDNEATAAQLVDLRALIEQQREQILELEAELNEMGPRAKTLAKRLTRLKATLANRS